MMMLQFAYRYDSKSYTKRLAPSDFGLSMKLLQDADDEL